MKQPIKNPETEALAQRIAAVWREKGLPAANAEWAAHIAANAVSVGESVAIKSRIEALATGAAA